MTLREWVDTNIGWLASRNELLQFEGFFVRSMDRAQAAGRPDAIDPNGLYPDEFWQHTFDHWRRLRATSPVCR
jgi:hypothetical protein